ncbi:MAG: Bax inhibitor-1/YccA family protein [Taibaiella sp.]|nr:Bax inhibitor-1/YccA family protein [Taibaiella sp.]
MEKFNQQQFSQYRVLQGNQIPAGAISKRFMSGVFLWMFMALGVSALFAFLFAANADLSTYVYTITEKGPSLTGIGTLIALSPLAFVLVMSLGFNKLSANALSIIFIVYAAVMGISLSTLAITYTSGSLLACFASASAMFGVMAVMGYTTDKDLTSFGSLMMMGLVGIIISMMINFFLRSEAFGYLISLFGVAVFLGLTAYDVQKLKRIGAGVEFDGVGALETKKLSVIGALSLYLDFVNLFLFLLRIFGKRK